MQHPVDLPHDVAVQCGYWYESDAKSRRFYTNYCWPATLREWQEGTAQLQEGYWYTLGDDTERQKDILCTTYKQHYEKYVVPLDQLQEKGFTLLGHNVYVLPGQESVVTPVAEEKEDEAVSMILDDEVVHLEEVEEYDDEEDPDTDGENPPALGDFSDSDSESEDSDDEDEDEVQWSSTARFKEFKHLEREVPQTNAAAIRRDHPHLEAKTALPSDFFKLIFTDAIVDIMVTETNRFAAQEIKKNDEVKSPTPRSWIDTSRKELNVFLGLALQTCFYKKGSWESYWRKGVSPAGFGYPDFGRHMTQTRFQQILRYLHFADNESLPARGEENYRRTQKVQPIIKLLNESFKKYYTPSKDMSLDETRMRSKHRSGMRMFNSGKPAKYAIECLAVNCPRTGYLLFMLVKEGKTTHQHIVESGNGKTFDKVVHALNELSLPQGTTFYMDRLYTSVVLFNYMRNILFYGAVGTIQRNRKYYPHELLKLSKTALKGTIKSAVSTCGNIVAVETMDTKPVAMISTSTGVAVVNVSRKQKDGSSNVVTHPECMRAYNKHMGGTDLFDFYVKMCGLMDSLPRLNKYYKKLFFFFFSKALVNSYLLMKLYMEEHKSEFNFIWKMNQMEFQEQIVNYLLHDGGAISTRQRPPPVITTPTLCYGGKDQRKKQCVMCIIDNAARAEGQRIKHVPESKYFCPCHGHTFCANTSCNSRWHIDLPAPPKRTKTWNVPPQK